MSQRDQPENSSPAGDSARPAHRRRTIIASVLVAALVLSSLVWGGITAIQAVAAEERREAERVAALGALLDDRSTSAELLATSAAVLAVLDSEVARTLGDADLLKQEHAHLVDELDRPLERDTALTHVVAQHRLLIGARAALMAELDDATRAVIAEGRAVLDASPLADDRRKNDLTEAISALTALRQGQPSSYSARAGLLEAELTAAAAVRKSHADEKAEQERLAAERKAAEEAARQNTSGGGGVNLRDATNDAIDKIMTDRGCTRLSATRWSCPTDVDWD